ncbi:lysine exporter LysO family protein [Tissierella sp. MSJ-40]|uniref:Lysine exporter LysO family protein n=1 Tax=Tissierella simiarum TaxID=2841534 RepID=A0ABS6EBB5_9FIRM|nr:lysine exporter LysO family protein [Tissierella simiarum]MBU5440218.1 lysine exporter LysO family protein [Tissierella simiarum]
MSLKIFISVILGIGAGYFFLPPTFFASTDIIIDIGLCLLLFFVGIDIGKHKDVFIKIKNIGFKILLVPLAVIIGSISGSIVAGIILRMPLNEAGAVGAGLGWYTLSSMLLANYSTELSALAFIANVVREIIALITIPMVAKYIGSLESIASCGATAMDTSLPVISEATDSQTTIIAFITGVICTMSVPLLLPMILKL